MTLSPGLLPAPCGTSSRHGHLCCQVGQVLVVSRKTACCLERLQPSHHPACRPGEVCVCDLQPAEPGWPPASGFLLCSKHRYKSLSHKMGRGGFFSMPWLHPKSFPELSDLRLSRVFSSPAISSFRLLLHRVYVDVPGFRAPLTAGAKMLLSARQTWTLPVFFSDWGRRRAHQVCGCVPHALCSTSPPLTFPTWCMCPVLSAQYSSPGPGL